MDQETEAPTQQDLRPPDLAELQPRPPELGAVTPVAPPRRNMDAGPDPQDAVGDEVSVGEIPAFNTRLIAGLIDFLTATGIHIVLLVVLPEMLDRFAPLGAMAYLLMRDSLPFLDGQSIGKKAMKLRAVTLDGGSLSGNWQIGLLRNGVLILLLGIGEILVLLMREDKADHGRRLGDDIAKTKVIFTGEPNPPGA